jgi:hypothetical protein
MKKYNEKRKRRKNNGIDRKVITVLGKGINL